MFYEYCGKYPQEPESSYVGTVNGDSASQNFDFTIGSDDEPVMDPPLSEDEDAQQEDAFMADAHDDYPIDFLE